MRQVRQRLTYANVISTLALFLVLCGGAAYAAKVAKKSVGPSQLKANAVTTAKIKANAVTTRKIKRNAVANAKIKDSAIESVKIADGSITGTDIDAETMPFGQVVHKARGASPLPVTETVKVFPLSEAAYTQAANENDTFIGALDVTFSAECKSERTVTALVLLDSVDPTKPADGEVVGFGRAQDKTGVGTLTRRIELGAGEGATPSRFEPGTAKSHKLSLVVSGTCSTGTGITATFGGVNVIGTK